MGYDNEGYRKAYGSASPLGNYSFILRVEGFYEIPIKSVKVFTRNYNFEKIKEGGLNDYVHFKRKPMEEAYTLQIERYLSNSVLDPLANGTEFTIPLILQLQKTTEITASSSSGLGKVYVFTGAVVMGREYGGLDAEKSGLATETITIGYKELFVLPNIAKLGGEPDSSPPSSEMVKSQLERTEANRAAVDAGKKLEDAKQKASDAENVLKDAIEEVDKAEAKLIDAENSDDEKAITEARNELNSKIEAREKAIKDRDDADKAVTEAETEYNNKKTIADGKNKNKKK